MDVEKDIRKSLALLGQHKVLMAPQIIMVFITAGLFFGFLYFSGAFEVIWSQNEIQQFWTYDNILLLAATLTTGFLITTYITCISFSLIKLAIKKKSYKEMWKMSNEFFFRFLSLRILLFFIIYAPVIVAIFISGIAILLSPLAGIIGLLLIILLSVAYIIYFGIRFVFIIPSMYLNNKRSLESISFTYKMTGIHIKQALIVFALIAAANFGAGIIKNAVTKTITSFSMLLDISNIVVVILIFSLIFIMIILLEAAVVTLETIFLFYSYMDIESDESKK